MRTICPRCLGMKTFIIGTPMQEKCSKVEHGNNLIKVKDTIVYEEDAPEDAPTDAPEDATEDAPVDIPEVEEKKKPSKRGRKAKR